MTRTMLTPDEIRHYGFDWPGRDEKGPDRVAHVQVLRVAAVERGKQGTWKVLQVGTPRDQVQLYITPTGIIRVYRDGARIG